MFRYLVVARWMLFWIEKAGRFPKNDLVVVLMISFRFFCLVIAGMVSEFRMR
uniref:Uncharacterized protein n=1 Tax=Kalanchoe fedtschenkoi TaxID=63787 RepID=A0A7N0V7W4_KALFE